VRDLAVLFLHVLATVARLAGPGGARSVIAESVLVKHQLRILNRSRKRSPNLRLSDRVVAGVLPASLRSSVNRRLTVILTSPPREPRPARLDSSTAATPSDGPPPRQGDAAARSDTETDSRLPARTCESDS